MTGWGGGCEHVCRVKVLIPLLGALVCALAPFILRLTLGVSILLVTLKVAYFWTVP